MRWISGAGRWTAISWAVQSLGLDIRVLTEDAQEVEIQEDLGDDGEGIDVNMEGHEDIETGSVYYDDHNPDEDSLDLDEENDDDLDFDPDLAASGFSVGDIETLEDPMFGDDL